MKKDPEELRKFVEHWKQLGPILDQINADELRAMDQQEAIRQIMPMCDWAIEHSEPRTTSGLVEQQRYFAKMREKLQKPAAALRTEGSAGNHDETEPDD